jgi:PAS domain S-box-containing protein
MSAAAVSLSVFNALPGAFLLLSPELVIEAASDDYLAATLTQRDELVGRHLFDAFPDNSAAPDARATHNLGASLAQVLATGQPHTMAQQHYDVPDPDRPGRFVERHWQPSNVPVHDEQGRVAHLIHTVANVSDQVRAADQLRESQAREQVAQATSEREHTLLQALLAQAPVAIGLFQGAECVVRAANDLLCAMWGYSPDQVLGRPLLEGVPELRDQGFTELLQQVARTRVPFVGSETPAQLRQADGQVATHYFNFVYQPLYDAAGAVLGVVDIAVDVTEQVLARQQVERLNQELEARVAERTQQLAAQQRLLRQILAQMPAAVATFSGPAHEFTFVNAPYQAIVGGRARLGQPLAEVLPEAVEQGFVALLDQVYVSGEPYQTTDREAVFYDPGATEPRQHYLDLVYQPLRDEAGQVQGLLAFVTDVTERVNARRARETKQQELQHLFEQAPVAIAIFSGPQYVIELANPAVCAIWGRTQQQALHTPLFELLPEAAGQGFEQLLDGVMATGAPYVAHELPSFIDRNGRRDQVYWNFIYQPLLQRDGRTTAVTVVATEVTEQVLARRASEASAQQLRLLTDALPVLIGYLDREERYHFANQAYQPWFGQEPAALLGQTMREVAGERAYQNVQAYVARALAGERVEYEAEMPYRPGFTRHIRTTYVPDAQGGQVVGFYALVSDITEQVEARRQVERLNEELTAANGELQRSNTQLTRTNVDLDNFIYTASHDLKAPISNIEGLLLALQHELPPEGMVGSVPTMLGMMQEATERFQRTIGHLTDISRLQKEHAAGATAVNLAQLVHDVRLDLAPLLRQTQGQLTVQVPETVVLLFSEKNLRSVVYNLLSNALKYRHPGRVPAVHLRYYTQENYQVLEVQDNGLGLDLTQGNDKLFGMFQRLHTHVEGSGIGLYLV